MNVSNNPLTEIQKLYKYDKASKDTTKSQEKQESYQKKADKKRSKKRTFNINGDNKTDIKDFILACKANYLIKNGKIDQSKLSADEINALDLDGDGTVEAEEAEFVFNEIKSNFADKNNMKYNAETQQYTHEVVKGNKTYILTYDKDGNLVQKDVKNNKTGTSSKIEYQYDKDTGKLSLAETEVTDKNGNVSKSTNEYKYDGDNLVSKVKTYKDKDGKDTGKTVTTNYNDDGKVESSETKTNSGTTTTEYNYDNNTTTTTVKEGDKTTITTLDEHGNPTRVEVQEKNPSKTTIHEYNYTYDGDKIKSATVKVTMKYKKPKSNEYTVTKDGLVPKDGYEDVTEKLSGTVEYTYKNGHITQITRKYTDKDNKVTKQEITYIKYDNNGNKIKESTVTFNRVTVEEGYNKKDKDDKTLNGGKWVHTGEHDEWRMDSHPQVTEYWPNGQKKSETVYMSGTFIGLGKNDVCPYYIKHYDENGNEIDPPENERYNKSDVEADNAKRPKGPGVTHYQSKYNEGPLTPTGKYYYKYQYTPLDYDFDKTAGVKFPKL